MNTLLRTDLDDFLFARIADDATGMPLTVLTVLARTGVDPWTEAANLAALSRESATRKLIALMAAVPNGPAPGEATDTLASHLVGLLHPSSRRQAPPASEAAPVTVVATQPKLNPRDIYYLLALILILGALWAQGR